MLNIWVNLSALWKFVHVAQGIISTMEVCVQKVNLIAYQEQQLLVLWKAILAIQRS